MKDLIYSTQDVFQNYLKNHGCQFFNIPEYQRGYKWTSDNVIQLLEDLKNFKKASEDEFYCLQNITVAKGSIDGATCMNVIDGQQRLTTLFIIISYLQRNFARKIIFLQEDVLKYSVRETTDRFLKEKIKTGVLWDNPIVSEEASSKDLYYIMEVAKSVKEWFESNQGVQLESTILKDLKLIVNEVDHGEEETVFASLNGGKVELDGADLVRAILITRAAKQKYPAITTQDQIHQIANDDINLNISVSVSSQGKINEYRVKLGVELDKMNRWWSDRDVRDYFEQLLPKRISQNRSFKYNEYPIDLLYYAFYEAYKNELFVSGKDDKDLDLRHFEHGLDLNNRPGDDHLEFYKELKEFHLTLVDWYNDTEIYNLVGYLMYNYKTVVSFEFLWAVWRSSHTKSDFKDKIKRIVRYQLAVTYAGDLESDLDTKDILWMMVNGEKIDDVEDKLLALRKDILNTSSVDWYEKDFTIKFLPLLDILPYTIKIGNKTAQSYKRLNQMYLKRTGSEDKEHVRSQTRPIDIDNMSEEDRIALQEENRRGLNSIGNIVLLHESINRSYGNDKLILKMVRIYSEHIMDDINAYIRPHTFDVFMSKMKNMEQNGMEKSDFFWTDEDIYRTANNIDAQLASYLSFPDITETLNLEDYSHENG